MKNYLFFLFGMFSFLVFAQEYSVELFPNRVRMSWETVSMSTESDLGFVGIGFDLFHLVKKTNTVYVGINSFSAVTGIRPGLITIGMSGGWCPQISKKGLFLDVGGFIGGGGGGGADDGGGLIIRPHVNLEQRFGKLGVRLGMSRIDFPSGNITGNQVNVGFTYHGTNFFKVNETGYRLVASEELATKKIRVAMVGTQYFNLSQGSVSDKPDVVNVGLLGMQLEASINASIYGMLKLNGAMSGGTDGYMSIFIGMGGRLPILENRLYVESRLLMGPTGGGGVESGGGATAQAEVGFSVQLGNSYDLKVMTGKTFSPWGPFDANHVEIGVGKSFDRLFPEKISKSMESFNVSSKKYYQNNIAFSFGNRTYFPPNLPTKNGDLYLKSFNSLVFEVQKFIGKRVSINGGTVWAYEGDYGAYAEGLLGITYYQPIFQDTKLSVKGMIGAAGGGAIDVGAGLLFEYALGLERAINDRLDAFIHLGQTQPIEGNFNPISLDLGFKFHISQLLLK